MIKIIWIFFFLISYQDLLGQENLVPNGDFETELNCPASTNSIANWFVPNSKEVDLTNLCPYVDWWRFIRDKKTGYNNSQCGFIETFYKGYADDNIHPGRIYLSVKLLKPLVEGQEYYFEMKVKAVDTFPNYKLVNTVFTNSQDVAFTREQPIFDYDFPRNFYQIRPVITSKIHLDYEWHTISKCFVADGSEQYLIIGNFHNDANTETAATGKKNTNFPNGMIADYAIDDIVLTETNAHIKDTAFCINDKVDLNINKKLPSNLNYQWSDGSTGKTFSTNKSGQYSITLYFGDACFHSEPFTVTSLPVDFKTKVIESKICQGKSQILNASIGAPDEKIKWNNGRIEKEITVTQAGNYTASITNKCTHYTQEFKVNEQICEDGVYIPNAFVPKSGSEFKPLFKSGYPDIIQFKMMILDRWGNLLFVSEDKRSGWDGSFNNSSLSDGVYVYYIQFTYVLNEKPFVQSFKGDLTLLHNDR